MNPLASLLTGVGVGILGLAALIAGAACVYGAWRAAGRSPRTRDALEALLNEESSGWVRGRYYRHAFVRPDGEVCLILYAGAKTVTYVLNRGGGTENFASGTATATPEMLTKLEELVRADDARQGNRGHEHCIRL